jgi:hypothetical protein
MLRATSERKLSPSPSKFKHALAFYYSTLVTLKTCTATRRSTFSTLMSHLSHLVNYLKSTLQNFPLAFVDHVASFPHAVQIHAATPGHRRASSTLQRSQGRIPRSRRASRTYTRGLLHARRAFDGVLGACVRQHASSAPLTRYARVIETPPPSLGRTLNASTYCCLQDKIIQASVPSIRVFEVDVLRTHAAHSATT